MGISLPSFLLGAAPKASKTEGEDLHSWEIFPPCFLLVVAPQGQQNVEGREILQILFKGTFLLNGFCKGMPHGSEVQAVSLPFPGELAALNGFCKWVLGTSGI